MFLWTLLETRMQMDWNSSPFQIGTPTCSVLKNEVCLTDNVADILSLSILYRLLPLEE